MLARTERPLPEVAFTRGGIIRLSAYSEASGANATSFQAPATVFASAITLRPLVSVPAIDGNLRNCAEVSPIWVMRSAIWVVCSASVSVAGPAASINSLTVWFLSSICCSSRAVSLIAVDSWSDRALRVPNVWLVLEISVPKA